MKNSSLGKLFRRFALCAAVACPMAVSCDMYDDTAIKEQIDMIINKLYDIEQRMNSEIDALNALLKDQLFISKVERNTETGVVVVTISDGRTLELLPEKELTSMVTYITSGGVDYWAYIDKDGKKQYFFNDKGEAIPVISEKPEVITRDDDTFLVIGGVEYPLSGNSVFSNYELITNELTGEVYAVRFTFGENMSFTVTVDGAAGFMFMKNEIWSQVPISEMYVPNGMKANVQYQAFGVVDYLLQIPDGWRVREYADPMMGNSFEITAPSKALVDSGSAADGGELKVVAVLEGGKAMIAKLDLTTVPFKEFGVSFGKADVKMNNGLSKFAYGICETSSFDEAAVYAKAVEILDLYDYPAGYGLTFDNLVAEPLEDVLQAELVPGESYTFWAMPALYDEVADGYILKEGTFEKIVFTYTDVNMEIVNQSSRDAKIDIKVQGADSYYFGISPKESFFAEDIVHLLNIPEYYTPKTATAYSGSAFEFAGITSEPGTEYVAWLVIAEDGKTYTEPDLLICGFKTEDLQPGSAVKVVAEIVAETLDVTAKLTAAGGETIYYSFLTVADAARYTDDAARAAYLFDEGDYGFTSEDVVARASDFISKLKPETSMVLMAVATDSEGKYSEVLYKECSTTGIQYNDMKVSVEILLNSPDEIQLGVTTTGGEVVEYLYWIGKTEENTWKSSNYLGKGGENAQVYMALNPNASILKTAATKYPVTDGVISIKKPKVGEQYAIVIMAKGKEGLYSKVTELLFLSHSVNIGKIVMKDEGSKYAAAQPTVSFIAESFVPQIGMMSGAYSFHVTIPTGFTAYVLAGTDAYMNDGDETVTLSAEEKIIKIIGEVDNPRDADRDVNGVDMSYHFEHGDPSNGNAVIWASEEFHDSRCDCGGNYETDGTRYGEETTIHHMIHINDGKQFQFSMPGAIGSKDKVVDRVFIVCQDLEGNCYETFEWDVPVEYWINAGSN